MLKDPTRNQTATVNCDMKCLLVLTLALAAKSQEGAAHDRHWRNYLTSLLVHLAQELPKCDLRHELWKQFLSGRLRSFLVGKEKYISKQAGESADYDDLCNGEDDPSDTGDGEPKSGVLKATSRRHMADGLLVQLGLAQRHRRVTKGATPMEVFSLYRHTSTQRSAKRWSSTSTDPPHLYRFLDILNAHGARNLRQSPPRQVPLHCLSSLGQNGSTSGRKGLLKAESTEPFRTASHQPPFLLVVPGLMAAPRDDAFGVFVDSKTTNTSDLLPHSAQTAASTSALNLTIKLRRLRLRFVLLLVTFTLALSVSLACYMRSYLAKYKQDYEVIRNAQFL